MGKICWNCGKKSHSSTLCTHCGSAFAVVGEADKRASLKDKGNTSGIPSSFVLPHSDALQDSGVVTTTSEGTESVEHPFTQCWYCSEEIPDTETSCGKCGAPQRADRRQGDSDILRLLRDAGIESPATSRHDSHMRKVSDAILGELPPGVSIRDVLFIQRRHHRILSAWKGFSWFFLALGTSLVWLVLFNLFLHATKELFGHGGLAVPDYGFDTSVWGLVGITAMAASSLFLNSLLLSFPNRRSLVRPTRRGLWLNALAGGLPGLGITALYVKRNPVMAFAYCLTSLLGIMYALLLHLFVLNA